MMRPAVGLAAYMELNLAYHPPDARIPVTDHTLSFVIPEQPDLAGSESGEKRQSLNPLQHSKGKIERCPRSRF